MQNLILNITQKNFNFIEHKNINCFILPATMPEDFVQEFILKAKDRQKLVLISGETAALCAQKYKADGILLDVCTSEQPQKILKSMQQKLKNMIIGVICRNRRHEAMLVSECEPDFICLKIWREGLEKNMQLLQWYNELFLLPCAAFLQDPQLDYTTLPAEYIILNDVNFR